MRYPIQVLFREYFEGILAAIFLALFLRFFVLNVLYIPTENMQPSLVKGDFVLGWRLSYGFPLPLMKGERLNFKKPNYGDLIAFRFPGDEEQIIIRRVIGLPGDEISIEKGIVKINGEDLPLSDVNQGDVLEQAKGGLKSYMIQPNPNSQMSAVKVSKGALFVLSDNRLRADDSRDWGLVPMQNVESEIGFIWLSVDNSTEELNFLWGRIFSWVR